MPLHPDSRTRHPTSLPHKLPARPPRFLLLPFFLLFFLISMFSPFLSPSSPLFVCPLPHPPPSSSSFLLLLYLFVLLLTHIPLFVLLLIFPVLLAIAPLVLLVVALLLLLFLFVFLLFSVELSMSMRTPIGCCQFPFLPFHLISSVVESSRWPLWGGGFVT